MHAKAQCQPPCSHLGLGSSAAQCPWQPGPVWRHPSYTVLASLGLVEAPGNVKQGVVAVEDYAHLVQMVVSLGGTLGDPGGLAQKNFALDEWAGSWQEGSL